MDYAQFATPVLAALGGGLQWLRQFKGLHDIWIGAVAFGLACAAYGLTHPLSQDLRLEIILAIVVIPGYTATVLGGTFAAARAAAGGLAAIPKTNSK